jgi:hypothetical protein
MHLDIISSYFNLKVQGETLQHKSEVITIADYSWSSTGPTAHLSYSAAISTEGQRLNGRLFVDMARKHQ